MKDYLETFRRIGQRLKEYRLKKGLTQQELAERLGVTWEMVSRYERGENLTIGRLIQLSQILGFDLSTLFEVDDVAILREDHAYSFFVGDAYEKVPVVFNNWPANPEELKDKIKSTLTVRSLDDVMVIAPLEGILVEESLLKGIAKKGSVVFDFSLTTKGLAVGYRVNQWILYRAESLSPQIQVGRVLRLILEYQ